MFVNRIAHAANSGAPRGSPRAVFQSQDTRGAQDHSLADVAAIGPVADLGPRILPAETPLLVAAPTLGDGTEPARGTYASFSFRSANSVIFNSSQPCFQRWMFVVP